MTVPVAQMTVQRISFVVIRVENALLDTPSTADEIIASYASRFPGLPVILVGHDPAGKPRCFGREDIARFLSFVAVDSLPWEDYPMD